MTSSILSDAFCSRSWFSMLVSMPPGTCESKMRESTPLSEPSN